MTLEVVVAITLSAFSVGLVIGYVKGNKQGYLEGWDGCADVQREAHRVRGQKAAQTRKAKGV